MKTASQLDLLIHAPNRLQICALLTSSAEMEFKVLKEYLEVSDSVLSKHLKVLEEAKYISHRKRKYMGRPRTWLSLTDSGKKAFQVHVKALKEIVDA
jgi:DNA-binding MarR family transcriptional regulator